VSVCLNQGRSSVSVGLSKYGWGSVSVGLSKQGRSSLNVGLSKQVRNVVILLVKTGQDLFPAYPNRTGSLSSFS
jgi:hypothetical protein